MAGDQRFEADNIVVAMGHYQRARIPAFARDLDPSITQIHAASYRNQEQLRSGDVLIVGSGNSGAEIAMESVRRRRTFLAGEAPGEIPFQVDGLAGRLLLTRLVLRGVFHRVFTIRTPIGRRVRAKVLHRAAPLIRTKARHLVEGGVQCVPRLAGVRDARPVLEDGRVLDVANVIWCTGFDHGFSWIDLPVFGPDGDPQHEAGVSRNEPGLYFVGLHFQYAFSSGMIHGVGRDAARIAGMIAAAGSRVRVERPQLAQGARTS